MIPQLNARRIGKVSIVDMNGSITGLWTTRVKAQLERVFHQMDGTEAILNFRHVTDLDTLGAKSLFQAVSGRHLGILSGNRQIMDLFNYYPESKEFRVFNSEEDLVKAYGPDLLGANQAGSELRGNLRLQTAMAVRFSYEQGLERRQCIGIISNLSQNGFFIEYIDILSVEDSLTNLNPYDIEEVDFTISLPTQKTISGRGKVLHRQLGHDQFGIGIHIERLNPEDEKHFEEFIKSQKQMVNYQEGR